MSQQNRREEGFPGERQAILPESVLGAIRQDPLLKGLCPVRAGFYPHAEGHYVERLKGSNDALVLACVAGSGRVRLGGRWWKVETGQAAILPPRKPHAYMADEETPWSLEWVHLTGQECTEYFRTLGFQSGAPVLQRLPVENASLGLESVLEILELGYARLNLLEAATECRRVFVRWAQRRTQSSMGKIDLSLHWMREHLRETATLDQLADQTGMSTAHYRTLFRERTGYPPMEYFHRLRIQEACRLLATSGMRVSEIAELTGYPDPYYFSRAFKRVMDCGPREFRARMKR